jgi:RIO kinase 1
MANEAELLETLKPFVRDKLIGDVLRIVKSGKEAVVYCCAAGPAAGTELLAAKIYLPRERRKFTDDSLYRQGRHYSPFFRRAVAARNRVGLAAMYDAWIEHEYATLNRLHAAGADVPRPIAQAGRAMLMEFIGDRHTAAPPLYRAGMTRAEAPGLFYRVLHNIELWLSQDRVHGDLSAYNLLYWNGAIKAIDFPQAVHPLLNDRAYELFERDITRVCEFWRGYGVREDAQRIATDLWVRWQFGVA